MASRGPSQGRGRARGRGTTAQESKPPGQGPPAPSVSAQPQVAPPPAAPAGVQPVQPVQPTPTAVPPASGRATYRGSSKTQPVGGNGNGRPTPEGVARQLGAMEIAPRPNIRALADEQRSSRFNPYYPGSYRPKDQEGNYKDKRGTGNVLNDRLKANFFKLTYDPDWRLYQYHVDFNPPVESKKMKTALLMSHKDLIGDTRAFDGMILFLPHRLPDPEYTLYSNRRFDNANIQIKIRFTCEIMPRTPQTIQVMNIIWRRILAMMGMTQIQRHYFNTDQAIHVREHGLDIIPGFQTSILEYERDVLLEIDIAHKILKTETVLDFMYNMYNRVRRDEAAFRQTATKNIVGTIVMTRYNNKTYRVDEICWEKRPSDTFRLGNGTDKSFNQYYLEQYQYTIEDQNQPLLASMPKKRDIRRGQTEALLLVPELCFITGLSDEARADFNVMKDVAVHTRIGPDGRVIRLMNFMQQVKSKPEVSEELRKWNLDFESNLASVPHRVLDCEPINMLARDGSNVRVMYKQEEADWGRDMRGKLMRLSVPLKSWIIFFPRNLMQNARDLAQTVAQVGPPMGMKVEAPQFYELQTDRNEHYLIALREQVNPSVQMVVCVLPNNKKDRYDTLKKFCCIDCPGEAIFNLIDKELKAHQIPWSNCLALGSDNANVMVGRDKGVFGFMLKAQPNLFLSGCVCHLIHIAAQKVPSQMVLSKTLSKAKNLMSVATKIAIQMNCKMGGVVWSVNIPIQGTMIVGIDTYHDSSQRGRSCGGVVATVNQDFTRYYSTVTFQMTHQELSDKLVTSMTECLRAFKATQNSIPERVVVFRDGVGDGQLDVVANHECPQIYRALLKAGGENYQAKMAYVLVRKRINVRFFKPRDGSSGARGSGDMAANYVNPGPGTVIDDVATKPSWYDFYLVSQSVRQGTVGPTHYNVIHDTSLLKPDHIQKMAYKLCHMYYNWQGTIRVPAPCMYAHKLAFLSGQSLHAEFNHRLADKLFFL